MSIPALNWCIEQKALPPGEWVVLFHLCHAHTTEHGCFPSQEFLAGQTNMSLRSIVRHLKSLEDAGLIRRQRRFNRHGDRLSDLYVMPFEKSWADGNQPSANLASGQMAHGYMPNGAQIMHEMACNNRVYEEYKEEPPMIPQAEKPGAKARLPSSWVLSNAGVEYALSKGLLVSEIEELADDFRSYWTDRTDAGGRKTARGWEQAWRNRVTDRLATIIRNRRATASPENPTLRAIANAAGSF